MSLRDSYNALGQSLFPACKTCRWYENLPPGDQAFFDDKVETDDNNGRLLRSCREEGLSISASSFRNHVLEHHKLIKDSIR